MARHGREPRWARLASRPTGFRRRPAEAVGSRRPDGSAPVGRGGAVDLLAEEQHPAGRATPTSRVKARWPGVRLNPVDEGLPERRGVRGEVKSAASARLQPGPTAQPRDRHHHGQLDGGDQLDHPVGGVRGGAPEITGGGRRPASLVGSLRRCKSAPAASMHTRAQRIVVGGGGRGSVTGCQSCGPVSSAAPDGSASAAGWQPSRMHSSVPSVTAVPLRVVSMDLQ